jgi:hypothetical protein
VNAKRFGLLHPGVWLAQTIHAATTMARPMPSAINGQAIFRRIFSPQ